MKQDLEQVVKDIENLTNQTKSLQDEATKASERGDDETLSTSLTRLARNNSALGKKAAFAEYVARNAKIAVESKRARKTIEYSKTIAVNKSELQAKLDVEEDLKIQSEAQLVADEAKYLFKGTESFLKLAQSRLSLIKSDKRG